jgi:hypothetical protein
MNDRVTCQMSFLSLNYCRFFKSWCHFISAIIHLTYHSIMSRFFKRKFSSSSSCIEAWFKGPVPVQECGTHCKKLVQSHISNFPHSYIYVYIFSTCCWVVRPWCAVAPTTHLTMKHNSKRYVDHHLISGLENWSRYNKMPMANLPFQISTESNGWIKGNKPFYSIVLVRRSWWKPFLQLGFDSLLLCIHRQQKSLEHSNLPFQISTESNGWIKGDKPFYSIVLVRRLWWKPFLQLGFDSLLCAFIYNKRAWNTQTCPFRSQLNPMAGSRVTSHFIVSF